MIRIWECDATSLLSQPELLPLAVLAKSKAPELLLSQVAAKIAKIENQRKQSNIAVCVELLAGINYSKELIAMYLQEDILAESVIYQEIINRGIEQGIEQGGKTEAISLISRLLNKRFGQVSETLKPQMSTLSIEQLETLGEHLFDFNSFEDVVAWLQPLKKTL